MGRVLDKSWKYCWNPLELVWGLQKRVLMIDSMVRKKGGCWFGWLVVWLREEWVEGWVFGGERGASFIAEGRV